MKRFYRQRKKAVNKKPSNSRKKSKVPPVPQDDYDPEEMILRVFDMNMAYGPCVGLTRVERLERAQKMGMNPPKEIERLLKSDTDIKFESQCLWNKRVFGCIRITPYFYPAVVSRSENSNAEIVTLKSTLLNHHSLTPGLVS